jgi:pimeloyl-ACP methyl ester carboxylesterase
LLGLVPLLFWLLALLLVTGCKSTKRPVGADLASSAITYRQTHENPVGYDEMSYETREIVHRYGQDERYDEAPDDTLRVLQEKALSTRDRGVLFALSELNYLTAARVQQSLKPWEPKDARDYYLASAVYAWLFLFGDAAEPPPGAFDLRFRTACDLYNYGLGWALTEPRGTNAVALLEGGSRTLPPGRMELKFKRAAFPWPLERFDRFLLADRFLVRGLSVRNRQPGLGAPLIAVTQSDPTNHLSRAIPATVLLRVNGGLADLAQGRLRGTLELYSPFEVSSVAIDQHTVPLETDTTVPLAYALNQQFVWKLGRMQFLSDVERIPTGVYPAQPYQPGRIPVVFVHGTFSSPITWAEMANTLAADPELRQRCQFWYFIYNSGNPTIYSANRLREALAAKIREFDPDGRDPALRQMVVIGHSQGGLVTKMTATDTGDRLLYSVIDSNKFASLPPDRQALLRKYTCYEALPFVTRVVFISTPHRGSYSATGLARNLSRKLLSLPGNVLRRGTDLAGVTKELDLPKELKGTPTSIDSMSPKNPVLLTLADTPVAPGIKANSIIAVKGDGDYHEGKDGLVKYDSAHVDYAESEFIVRSPHSCQRKPECIEEVRRILHEHLAQAAPPAK